jgi:signal transduction histidine kinase
VEPVQNGAGTVRAHTNAGLGAERATTDEGLDRAALRSQRVLDDLIERDRISADERLLKYRKTADANLAVKRSAALAGNRLVATERLGADDDKKAERVITDSIVDGERRRADAAAKTERRERQRNQSRLRHYRHDTDHRLSSERSEADESTVTLGKLRHALTDAKSEQERRNDIFKMVTHDLRNPLFIIALNAQWITEDATETSSREAAEQITLAAARMERLLMDLLDCARSESGVLRIVKSNHDVGVLLAEVFQAYHGLFSERRMILTVEPPFEPIVASFDHDRIVQVLSNLLSNAMKFMAPGGTAILRVVRHETEIEFLLSDSGPGIHLHQLPHVFERFWQVDSNTRRGLGLGLYICEQLVVAHGGHIWVESEVGKGATFRFTLPLSDGRSPVPLAA